MNRQKLEQAFSGLHTLHQKIAQAGVAVNIYTVQKEFTTCLDDLSEAINEGANDVEIREAKALEAERADELKRRREEIWIKAWCAAVAVHGGSAKDAADICLSDFDAKFGVTQ
jgi:hypothetical protein